MASILTSSHYDDFLSDEVRQRSDLDLLVDRAEIRVVDRYRTTRPITDNTLRFGAFDGDPGVVRIYGWEEDSNGDPDTSAMDAELVKRLRLVIGRVADLFHDHEEQRKVEEVSEGDRSVSYDDSPQVPASVFQPLDKYDQRQPYVGRW